MSTLKLEICWILLAVTSAYYNYFEIILYGWWYPSSLSKIEWYPSAFCMLCVIYICVRRPEWIRRPDIVSGVCRVPILPFCIILFMTRIVRHSYYWISVVYKPGEEYVYHYRGHVLSGIPLASKQYSGLLIDTFVTLQFRQDSKVIMKVGLYTIGLVCQIFLKLYCLLEIEMSSCFFKLIIWDIYLLITNRYCFA